MFKLENDILYVELPQGKIQQELVDQAKEEINKMAEVHGKNLKINGRCTNGLDCKFYEFGEEDFFGEILTYLEVS